MIAPSLGTTIPDNWEAHCAPDGTKRWRPKPSALTPPLCSKAIRTLGIRTGDSTGHWRQAVIRSAPASPFCVISTSPGDWVRDASRHWGHVPPAPASPTCTAAQNWARDKAGRWIRKAVVPAAPAPPVLGTPIPIAGSYWMRGGPGRWRYTPGWVAYLVKLTPECWSGVCNARRNEWEESD